MEAGLGIYCVGEGIADHDMKKLLLLTLLVTWGYADTFSQSWKRIGGWGNQFSDIKWVTEELAYVTGENIILKTMDGGLSWVEQEAPTDRLMYSLDFADEENGFIVGQDGAVYHTDSGGKNWKVLDLGTGEDLKSIKYLSGTQVIIVGKNGTKFKSNDGGQSWELLENSSEFDLNAVVFVNSDLGFLVTSGGEIMKTVDGGLQWKPTGSPVDAALNDIYFLNDTVGYVVGKRGIIVKTTNGGDSWNYVSSGMQTDFNKVLFHPNNPQIGLVVGVDGTILRTMNGGLTFANVNSRTEQDIHGISFKGYSNTVYAVAASGVMISSTNSGSGWAIQFSGKGNDYSAVRFLTDQIGYIIGENGLILSTNNGGVSFTDRSRSGPLPFNTLYFTSNSVGFVGGDNGTILNTTNSGSSWVAFSPDTHRNIYGMYFFSYDHGYVVGGGGYIAKTDDRGINWTTIDQGDGRTNLRDIGFFPDSTGIVVGDSGWISRSEDGLLWETVHLPENADLNALAIQDENTAIAGGKGGILYKTVDRGKTWNNIKRPSVVNINDIDFVNESIGFAVGDKGKIYRTVDGGENWTTTPTGTYQKFTGISFGEEGVAYAVGENGSLFTYRCSIPEAIPAISGSDETCIGQQIYTIEEGIEPGVSYQWRVDGGTVLEGQGTARLVVDWDGPGRHAVMVRGQNDCGDGEYAALEVAVSTDPEQVSGIKGNGAVCLNALEEYRVDSLHEITHIWEVEGGKIESGQGTSKVVVEWTDDNGGFIQVTPENSCGQGGLLKKKIQVTTKPGHPSPIDGPATVGLEEAVYSVHAVPGVNYQWSAGNNGTIVDGQGTGQIRVRWDNEGDFLVAVKPVNACGEGASQTLAVNVSLITGLSEIGHPSAINIFPNPSRGNILIIAKGIYQIVEIRIYSSSGQLIYHVKDGLKKSEFHVGELPRGVHTVMIVSRIGVFIEKIIVQ